MQNYVFHGQKLIWGFCERKMESIKKKELEEISGWNEKNS